MLIFIRKKTSQSMMEFATLIGVVVVALVVMFGYMRRSVAARLEHVREDFNESIK